ncbi:ATP-grasp domain-containing protein [Chitinophaga pinensis]|uniref:ATP-grasp domain-containing protein n=1 Tax=Chitinophaga pinensis (strain ATCC 43595 / DSM 2588 / LMG 13176 / NBRC 15968 / NCIMB 11800 / UQM 2034) TaxID=485918 RepID=A0A979GTF1_CHIPD|nr:hypothetical protein [Chitinophaga pinensis]ACU58580.1 conserved hypothetical protein [Chitinophaga pinensis DSM 2588]
MIAIHFDNGIHSFSGRWIEYCEKHNIAYKLVNCYASDLFEQLKDCDGLMWHWYQGDIIALQFARQLTTALEKMGMKVFPNSNTGSHFDDKISQGYLFTAIGSPMVPSYVFYEEEEARKWIESTSYPKVFKLKGGASSVNVKLVKNSTAAKQLMRKAFGKGFPSFDRVALFKDSILKAKRAPGMAAFITVVKAFLRIFIRTEVEKHSPRERGYLYFQEFIPDNKYDTRLVVIGNRCFGLRRYNRENDFRASGSGKFDYDKEMFDPRCIRIAFEVSEKLDTQSMAYDFIMDKDNKPLLVEMSYCFSIAAYDHCPGYWDKDLVWHEGTFKAQYFMAEDFYNSIK